MKGECRFERLSISGFLSETDRPYVEQILNYCCYGLFGILRYFLFNFRTKKYSLFFSFHEEFQVVDLW